MARSPQHHGRTTDRPDDPLQRSRPRRVVVTAWLIVAGFLLAAVFPVLAILFG